MRFNPFTKKDFIRLFGLKVGLYPKEQIPKDEIVLAVHPDNTARVKKELADAYAAFLKSQKKS